MPGEAASFERRPFPEPAGEHLRDYWRGEARFEGLYARYPLERPLRVGPPTSPAPMDAATAERAGALTRLAGGAEDPAAGLVDPSARFVLAGQQPGLLLGPALTAYKMATATALAAALARDGAPVRPLFWIASHDADLPEVDGVVVQARHGEPRAVRYPFGDVPSRTRVGELAVLPAPWRAFLEELRDACGPGGFLDDAIDEAAALVKERTPLTLLFARSALRFFPGLLLVDGRDAEIDPRGRAILAAAVRRPERTYEAMRDGAARLDSRGVPPRLPVEENRPPLFLVDGGVRLPLIREGGMIATERGERFDPGDLADRIEEGSVRATPNAALRPVVQDAVFPNVATVVGLSELVYHAQLGPLYELLGVRRPPLVPRASYTVIPARIDDQLRALGATPRTIVVEGETVDAAAPIDTLRFTGGAEGLLEEFLREAEETAPGAVPPDDPARSRLLREAERTAERVAKLVDRAGENRRNRLHRARQEILPGNRPQDTTISFFALFARFGPAFPEWIASNTGAEEPVPALVLAGGRKTP